MRTDKSRLNRPLINALISKRNVIWAVILRDMRTRFFNHGLGFIVVPLWPLVHMGAIIMIHSAAGYPAPYGSSAPLFYATGITPTLTFIYISRWMGYSVITNRAMMSFPVVKPADVMTGRACLEIISACITLVLMLAILWVTGQDPWPYNLEQAVSAFLAAIFLGFGMGFLVGSIALIYPIILTVWQLTIICLYISSGTLFVASNLPDNLSRFLAFSPVTVCVEWMRTAYYESYSDKLVAALYVFSFGAIALFLGLTIERIFRRHIFDR
ncbi:ABC transporter permease [Rhizobium sp. A37_96]